MTKPRLGVVLFQLGGPDSPAAVEPFLYNLFCDPDIIDFPGAWLARRPLAWWIAHRRAAIVGEHYEAIGGHSPIRRLTELQARRLEQALAPDFDARCFLAMRYWHPLTLEAVEAVRSAHRDAPLDMLVLLPLYPQYSFATTRSSLKEWRRVSAQSRVPSPSPREIVIEEFHLHPQYIGALVRNIETALARFADRSKVHLVFSAHGLPLSLIARGDPYQRQVQETVAAVMARGSGKTRNISTGGIYFTTERRLTVDEVVDFSLTFAGLVEGADILVRGRARVLRLAPRPEAISERLLVAATIEIFHILRA